MDSPDWDTSACFDYDAEIVTGQYAVSSSYLVAPQPMYTISGATSPVSTNSPQGTTLDYAEGSPHAYSFPAATWDGSSAFTSPSYATPYTHSTSYAQSHTIPSSTALAAFDPSTTLHSTGSESMATSPHEHSYSASAPSSYQFNDRDSTFWSYYTYCPSGENGPYFRLQPNLRSSEYYPKIIMHVEDPNRPSEVQYGLFSPPPSLFKQKHVSNLLFFATVASAAAGTAAIPPLLPPLAYPPAKGDTCASTRAAMGRFAGRRTWKGMCSKFIGAGW